MSKTTKEIVQNILFKHIDTVQVQELDEHEYLTNYGLDSTGILKLIIGIEDEFGFEVKDDDFDNENFQTLSCLISFVERKERENKEGIQ